MPLQSLTATSQPPEKSAFPSFILLQLTQTKVRLTNIFTAFFHQNCTNSLQFLSCFFGYLHNHWFRVRTNFIRSQTKVSEEDTNHCLFTNKCLTSRPNFMFIKAFAQGLLHHFLRYFPRGKQIQLHTQKLVSLFPARRQQVSFTPDSLHKPV